MTGISHPSSLGSSKGKLVCLCGGFQQQLFEKIAFLVHIAWVILVNFAAEIQYHARFCP
jgi:hypothetical protein